MTVYVMYWGGYLSALAHTAPKPWRRRAPTYAHLFSRTSPIPPSKELPIPSNSDNRCEYRKSDGKRCRSLRAPDHPSYCAQHAGWLLEGKKPEDLTQELLGPLGDLRTAAGVNYMLGRLVMRVAARRISRGEAAVLGYLAQLLLVSVKGVNDEVWSTRINETDNADLRRILELTARLTGEKK